MIGINSVCRMWDRSSGQEIQKVELESIPGDIELSQDGKLLTIPYGNKIAFYDAET